MQQADPSTRTCSSWRRSPGSTAPALQHAPSARGADPAAARVLTMANDEGKPHGRPRRSDLLQGGGPPPLGAPSQDEDEQEEENTDSARGRAGAGHAGDTLLDRYRSRADQAEAKLQEYIAAFKQSQAEADAFRGRLTRDLDRKVDLKFAGIVRELARPWTTWSSLSPTWRRCPRPSPGPGRVPGGAAFPADPGASRRRAHLPRRRAVRPRRGGGGPRGCRGRSALDGVVTETMRPGYRLGDQLVRPAAVAVGRASR